MLSVIWVVAGERERLTCAATNPNWAKWTPAAPTSAHWYRHDDLKRLIGAYLDHDAKQGGSQTVSEFVARFAGPTGTAKRKAVIKAVGLERAPLTTLPSS